MMKPSAALQQHRAAIRRIVESKCGRNVRVFGSVARGVELPLSVARLEGES
jgi:predicted nucleotidyltransferase